MDHTYPGWVQLNNLTNAIRRLPYTIDISMHEEFDTDKIRVILEKHDTHEILLDWKYDKTWLYAQDNPDIIREDVSKFITDLVDKSLEGLDWSEYFYGTDGVPN